MKGAIGCSRPVSDWAAWSAKDSVREWRDVYGTVIHAALSEGREVVTSLPMPDALVLATADLDADIDAVLRQRDIRDILVA